MGLVHVSQRLPCIVPRMDSPAHASPRMGVLRWMLWMFIHTGISVPVHRYQKQGKDIWSSVGEYVLELSTYCADLT